MKVLEPEVIHHIQGGVLEGDNAEKYTKYYKEVKELYSGRREDDPVVYEVYSYTKGADVLGNLNWGLTVLKPVLIDNECNMTKGHFHVNKDCAEIYIGIAGEGLLLLMDEKGNTWAEKVYEGSLHHIDGKTAHRLVNTGDRDLKVGACWPTSAGHDYQAIQDKEFGYRIYKRGGKLEFAKRQDHVDELR